LVRAGREKESGGKTAGREMLRACALKVLGWALGRMGTGRNGRGAEEAVVE
jgi:hypothetical protein